MRVIETTQPPVVRTYTLEVTHAELVRIGALSYFNETGLDRRIYEPIVDAGLLEFSDFEKARSTCKAPR